MSSYNYDLFINDFSKRTIENLKIIEAIKNDNDLLCLIESKLNISINVYEVTQMINSLFGLLIIPIERYKFDKNREETKEEYFCITGEPYDNIIQLINKLKHEKRYFNDYPDKFIVSSFLIHMRNALAHSGDNSIHFTSIEETKKNRDIQIGSAIFYDKGKNKTKNANCNFCVELFISEIRELSMIVSDMYINIEKNNRGRSDYEKTVKSRRNLMQNYKCRK